MINYATKIDDLLIPPANRLEKKQGDLKDYWAIRINDQWRVMFKWDGQDADDVQIIDYH
jgi:proteic killer suppression protein